MKDNNVVVLMLKDSLSDRDLSYLLDAAFEGGINYWCEHIGVKSYVGACTRKSDIAVDGGTLTLYAYEDEPVDLNKAMLLDGIRKYCEEQCITTSEMMDSHDAGTADTIIQYAVFGELVYG